MRNWCSKLFAWALAVLAIALFSACGSGESGAPDPATPAVRALWEEGWRISNDEQRRALADGVLTFEEYEAAALAAAQCVNEHGMQGEALFDAATNSYSVGARWQGEYGSPDDREKSRQSDACYEAHWYGIQQAWSALHQPSEQLLQAAGAALANCLRDAGAPLPEGASPADVRSEHDQPAFQSCTRTVQKEYGIPNFAGY